MTGYLVTWRTSGGSRGHYLQWIPADQSFGFYAAEPRFATVFGLLEAEREAAVQRVLGRDAVVVHDVLQRPAPHVETTKGAA